MKNILEIFHLNKTVGDIGIEIETEGENIQFVEPNGGFIWTTTKDGSLRGEYPSQAAEFVMKRPCLHRYVEKHLDTLIASQKEAKFNFSFRTSVHVHLNVQQLTENQVFNLIYTYYLLEGVMVKYCGAHREANRFCLRLQDADGCYDILRDLFSRGIEGLAGHGQDALRYAGLNLAAIMKYGSVEFRSMRGTLDKATLLPWVNAIYNMRNFAVAFQNVTDIHEKFLELGPLPFMEAVLQDEYEHFLTDESESQINLGFSLSIDMPFMYKVFHEKRKDVVEEKARKGEIRAMVRKPARNVQINAGVPAAGWNELMALAIQQDARRAVMNPVIYMDEFPDQDI